MRRHDQARLVAGLARTRERRRQALRPLSQGRQQIDHLVQRQTLQERRREAAADVPRCSRPRRPSRRRAPRRTRSAAVTAGRSPTCSRTSTSGRRAGRCTTSCPRTRSSGRDPSVKNALKTMAQVFERRRRTSPAGRPERSRPSSRPRSPRPSDAAEGGDGDRGRLRPGRHHRLHQAKPGTDYNYFPFPSIKSGSLDSRRRRRGHRRHVQGQARDPRAGEVLRNRAGRRRSRRSRAASPRRTSA